MIIEDSEFGNIIVRKNPLSKRISASVNNTGRLTISCPNHTPNIFIKRFINNYREEIKKKLPVKDPSTQRARDAKKKILMRKAKEYLPYRLEYYAKKYGYKYDKCRLSYAKTRWGSCSSNKTISLNIGLMNVPEVLRDYVIIHELAHLNHMDHSESFWEEVRSHDARYKEHRKKLKLFSPEV